MFLIKFILSFQLESLLFALLLNVFVVFLFTFNRALFKFLMIFLPLLSLFVVIIMVEDLFLHMNNVELSIQIVDDYYIGFKITSLGLVFASLICILWPFSIMYTIHFIKINNFNKPYLFLFLINMSIALSLGVAFAANILTLFILYESLTLCTLPLVYHNVDIKANRRNIINYYKFLQFISILCFLPAVAFSHNYGFSALDITGKVIPKFSHNMSYVVFFLFIIGVAKSTIFPVFYWLVNAMVASYPISALLHSLIIVNVGLFCIYKISLMVFGFDYLYQMFSNFNWIILLPIIGVIYSSIKALKTNVIKTILAYSTINHLNIALMSVFLFTEKSVTASVLHMISHSITKIAVFYSMGLVSSLVNNAYNVKNLWCAHKMLPFTSFFLLLFFLSLLGIPPFAGFVSKYEIIFAAIEAQNFLVVITLLFSSLCSAIYFFNIIQKIYFPLKDSRFILFNIKSHMMQVYKINSTLSDNHYGLEWKIFSPMIVPIGIFVILNIVFYFVSEHISNFLFI